MELQIAPFELLKIVEDQALAYGIQSNWMKAIISQESAWQPCAIRYESNYVYLFKTEEYAKHPLISLPTEIATQKMSWGLGQIMGGLAREQGHMGLMGELLSPQINCKHLAIRIQDLKKSSEDPKDIFSMYNGGRGAMKKVSGIYRNQSYVDSALRHLSYWALQSS